MGGRATTRSLDISDYSSSVNWGTPFSMTYGFETVIPLRNWFPTLRTSLFTPNNNDKLLERSLDLVDERREAAMVQLAYYQQKLK